MGRHLLNKVVGPRKDLSLEALRGCAAWVVVVYHFLLAFQPGLVEPNRWTPDGFTLRGTPLFALVNGEAAVTLFFVLSGYVLTLRIFETGTLAGLERSIVKRWPRLAGATTLVTVASAALFLLGAYRNDQAAELTASGWLRSFGNAGLGPSFDPSLVAAAVQGAVLTFFRGDHQYNAVLWTMRYELAGSFLAWAVATVMLLVTKRRTACVIVLVLCGLLHYYSPLFNAFLFGVILSRMRPERTLRITRTWSVPAFGLAIALLSYRQPEGLFEWMGRLAALLGSVHQYGYILGSMVLILLFSRDGPWPRLFDNRVGWFLGWTSFSIYLTHPLVLFSATSALFVIGSPYVPPTILLCLSFVSSVVMVLAFSIPLAIFDAWWTGRVDELAMRFVARAI